MRFLVCLFLLISVESARAAAITWQAASEIGAVHDPYGLLRGLEPGTPWTLTVTFDPDGPSNSLAPGCNEYSLGATSFTLGGFNYTQPTGKVYTNTALPGSGCVGDTPTTPAGMIQFAWTGAWTEEPGAWNLNRGPQILVAGYYDLHARDGRLPVFPIFNPIQGLYGGLFHQGSFGDQRFNSPPFEFRKLEQPTPVPEPATVALIGAGLAGLAARRRHLAAKDRNRP